MTTIQIITKALLASSEVSPKQYSKEECDAAFDRMVSRMNARNEKHFRILQTGGRIRKLIYKLTGL